MSNGEAGPIPEEWTLKKVGDYYGAKPWEMDEQNIKWVHLAPVFSEAEQELQKVAEKKSSNNK